jgi:DNA-binding CsgD family transcriptional regulator
MAGNGAATDPDLDSSEILCVRLRALVCSLIDRAGSNDDGCEQVMMDADLDGHRYLLIRMPAVERKATSLSPREVEIARLVAEGHSNKVIAAVLEISSWTVCTYLRRLFAKFCVSTRSAMVARLIEEGLMRDIAGKPRMSPTARMVSADIPGARNRHAASLGAHVNQAAGLERSVSEPTRPGVRLETGEAKRLRSRSRVTGRES